jgi:hypothetical protein
VSEETESGGVFGNLPRSRPGTRSPLRDPDEAARQSVTPEEPEAGEQTPMAADEPRASTPDREQLPDEEAAPEPEDSGGLEDLAWAGIAAAAEAATIGVRLASRAMEAVRDAGKRT